MFRYRISWESISAINRIVNILIAFSDTISLSADALILSAHILIAFSDAISLSADALIASPSLSNVARSPTVPGGDTPCLTAGDARRANPWESDAQISDAGSVAQHPLSSSQDFIFSLSHRHVVTL